MKDHGLRDLLAHPDRNKVQQGLELLRTLDDPALDSALAGKAHVDADGRVVSELPVDVTLVLLASSTARSTARGAVSLDLSFSKLRFLDLGGWDRVAELSVQGNLELKELKTLPPSLVELCVDDTPLGALPLLPQLKSLSAAGCTNLQLGRLPSSLESLSLQRAFLTAVPTNLPRLEILELDGTMIRMLGQELESLPRLRRLSLANTPLTRIYEPGVIQHAELRELDLRNTPYARTGRVARLRRSTHPLLCIEA